MSKFLKECELQSVAVSALRGGEDWGNLDWVRCVGQVEMGWFGSGGVGVDVEPNLPEKPNLIVVDLVAVIFSFVIDLFAC